MLQTEHINSHAPLSYGIKFSIIYLVHSKCFLNICMEVGSLIKQTESKIRFVFLSWLLVVVLKLLLSLLIIGNFEILILHVVTYRRVFPLCVCVCVCLLIFATGETIID
jgi:hypothetical protein